jgi:3-deoxy-manno-octulosonate cytidylyltransferase (CMP-KDO synthetase)
VATDHEDIFNAVKSFGGRAVMTSADLASGTDRVAAVARELTDVDVLVNVQGDEPELSGAAIDLAVELLENDPAAQMATLATPIRSREALDDPACVKVVCNAWGRAAYFSRSPIPFARTWSDDLVTAEPPNFYQHIGLYAYRREFLLKMAKLPQGQWERLESLEQLRVLEAGYDILVGVVDHAAQGIDTPDDYRAFVARQQAR